MLEKTSSITKLIGRPKKLISVNLKFVEQLFTFNER